MIRTKHILDIQSETKALREREGLLGEFHRLFEETFPALSCEAMRAIEGHERHVPNQTKRCGS
jgi:hypothetical protein